MHDTAARLCTLGLALPLLAGVSPARGGQDLGDRAHAVLRTHCGRCHGPGGPARGGFDYVLDRDRLVARNKVVPGHADGSALYQLVRQGEMPPPGQRRRPGATEVTLLKEWIDAGAPAAGAPPGATPPVDDAALLSVVLADLRGL